MFCALYAFAFGLVGAKLFYIIGNIGNVISGEMTVFQLFSSGFMFYGGFFGGAFGIFLYCKLFKIKMIKVFDALSLGLALGQCFGRIGCFCAGCCYGVPTNSPIGVVFTNPADISIPLGIPLVPVQLIESALCFSIFISLMIYGSKKNENGTFFRKDGTLFSLYCILYAVGRFIIEFWRGDAERGFVGLLSWSQFISIIILIVVSLIYIVLYVRKRRIIKADMSKDFLTN
ncbi:MAG TPA: prolipoprotein diacylglyceryl transferase family protein [Clostridia bacterium]|nr:prolipoprotein diacylglyceryl transferase family protein [Clostridia bacterium]